MKDFLSIQQALEKEAKLLAELNIQKERTDVIEVELKDEIKKAKRMFGTRKLPPEHRLNVQTKANTVEVGKVAIQHKAQSELVKKLREELKGFNLPQTKITKKDDAIPFLLLPVRVQTRFMTIKHVTRKFDKSLVIDVAKTKLKKKDKIVEKFNSVATADLTKPLILGTASLGRTGKNEFAAVGIRRVAKPTGAVTKLPKKRLKKIEDRQELWLRIFPDDIFIHSHEGELTDDELAAGKTYWERVFAIEENLRGGVDINPQDEKLAAWRVLHNRYGAPRATWIYKATYPKNHSGNQNEELPKAPKFETITVKEASWSKAPCTYMLPDRFVVRLYAPDGSIREVQGGLIPKVLKTGLDPNDQSLDAIEQGPEDIKFPDDLLWMTDFSAAVKVGMAIKVPLLKNEKKGFSKIVVVGIKASDSPEEGKQLLEKLFDNHKYKPGGMAIIPQGTPTNNNDSGSSGFSSDGEDAEESYRRIHTPASFMQVSNYENKKDAQRLTDALGIADEPFQQLSNSEISDVREAIMMNHALFPATIGYFTKQFLGSYVTISQRDQLRDFMVNFVMGRGIIPAVRIEDQPYGILPTTAFSKWRPDKNAGISKNLYDEVLAPLYQYWIGLSNSVESFGKKNASDKLDEKFLDIIGLHASSIDFFQRSGQGPKLTALISDSSGRRLAENDAIELRNILVESGLPFLQLFNEELILKLFHLKERKHLSGSVIDPLPLSETRTIKSFKDIDKNYIHWLEEAEIDEIRNELFHYFPEDSQPAKPKALLYLLLRHSLLIEYIDTPLHLLRPNGEYLVPGDFEIFGVVENQTVPTELKASIKTGVLREMNAAHIADAQQRFPKIIQEEERKTFIERTTGTISMAAEREANRIIEGITIEKNQFDYLDKAYAGFTRGRPMKEDLKERLRLKDSAVRHLLDLKRALRTLKDMPTARLERVFTEHLDSCHYRLDSWLHGLVNQRLELLRNKTGSEQGIHLGAYGYLEEVRPGKFKAITVAEIKNPELVEVTGNTVANNVKVSDLANPVFNFADLNLSAAQRDKLISKSFIYLGNDFSDEMIVHPVSNEIVVRPRENDDNHGFIPTPSMAHAVTAAVLRSGYEAHRKTGSPLETFAVDLSSKRVRKALYFLEGIRNGQELNALLGYQFERGLHERQGTLTELDKYIQDFREEYPLVGKNLTDPDNSSNSSLQQARHVVDGLALLEEYRKGGTKWAAKTGARGNSLRSLEAEAARIDESMDAVGDLLMAESVYQMAQGKPERAAAALRVLGGEGEVLRPEIVDTPRSGHFLTHRVCLQFNTAKGKSNLWGSRSTPRSIVEPNLNFWLASHLPDPKKIVIRVKWMEESSTNASNATPKFELLKISALNYQPIDFAYALIAQKNNITTSDLAVRIENHLRTSKNLKPEQSIELLYLDRTGMTASQTSLFSVQGHLENLMHLVTSGRALSPEDFLASNDVRSDSDNKVDPDPLSGRLEKIIAGNNAQFSKNYIAPLKTAYNQVKGLDMDSLPGNSATRIKNLRTRLLAMSLFGMPEAIPTVNWDINRLNIDALTQQAEAILKASGEKRNKAEELWTDAQSGGISTSKKIDLLQRCAQELFGKPFKVFPEYRLLNEDNFESAYNFRDLHKDSGEMPVEQWLQSISPVRPMMLGFHQSELLDELLKTPSANGALKVVQLPHRPDNRWMGMPYDKDFEPLNDTLSIVAQYPDDYSIGRRQAGILLDEWTEIIPVREIDTAVAMNFDQPNSEPPQTALLAVSPELTGSWQWNDLIATVTDTMQMAKNRAVEPDHVLRSHLTQIAPMVYGAINTTGNTPSLELGKNNPNIAQFYGNLIFQVVANHLVEDTN